MDDSDTPPSPPLLPKRSRTRGEPTRKAPKEHTRSYVDHSSKELMKLLVYEEQESKELRYSLQSLTSRCKDETYRADTAERRAKEAVLRFKEANDARLAALRDASRAQEELSLYKLQLEHAQREITRAQQLLDAIELLRYEAEEDAAKARSTARRLKEEKVIAVARDEGRREGYEEGIRRGREIGFEEGRAAAYARRVAEAKETGDTAYSSAPRKEKPLRPTKSSSSLNITPRRPPRDVSMQSPLPSTFFGPTSTTITTSATQPRTDTSPNTRPTSIGASQIESPIHPVPVRNMMMSPGHISIDYPPDGFIPTIDENARIRLPPPHELAPAPPTPQATPPLESIAVPLDADAFTPPPLMVPPPVDRTGGEGSISENEHSRDYMHTFTRAEAEVRRKPRRRLSSDSQSTTFSQFDLLSQQGPPVAHSGRVNVEDGGRPTVLSAIQEERASSLASSPYAAPSPYRDQQFMPSPIIMPTPHAPQNFSMAPSYNENQARSESRMSQPRSESRSSQPREQASHSRSQSRTSVGRDHGRAESKATLSPPKSVSRKGSVSSQLSNAGFNITVEPPSRPESTPSIDVPYHGGLLSTADAERSSTGEPSGHQPAPVPLPDNQLPPGFVPTSPLPPGFVPSSAPTPTPQQPVYPNYTGASQSSAYTAAGVALPPSSAGSIYRAYTPAQSAAGSSAPTVIPGSGPTSTYPSAPPSIVSGVAPAATPPVIPNATAHRYSRSALPGQSSSTSSSSQEDFTSRGSDSSSDLDSLTTPPERRRPLLGTPGTIPGVGGMYGVPAGTGVSARSSGYAAAPVPQGVVYPSTSPAAPSHPQAVSPHSTGTSDSRPRTTQAARVPLPSSVIAPSTKTSTSSSADSPTRTSASLGTVSGAARVPLPPSSVGGSERSAYPRVVPSRSRGDAGGGSAMSPLLIPARGM